MLPETDVSPKPSRWVRAFGWLKPQSWAGFFLDAVRLYVGIFSLNGRKTLFRMRKGRMRCPCQNPSDSGRAWETGCDAAMNWAQPERFTRLCPLLKKIPSGEWRCTVDTPAVRPFWLRGLVIVFGSVFGTYFVLAICGFIALRTIGYPLSFKSVVWPRAWHEVKEARAEYFFRKGEKAFQEKRINEAMMAFSMAYQLDHRSYSAGRVLAQIWQTGWPEISNRVYQQLMVDHPTMRAQTAEAWFHALLARGDFATLQTLAVERLFDDQAHANAWLNALLFATRQTQNIAALEKVVKQGSALPKFVVDICTFELAMRSKSLEEARALLSAPMTNPTSFEIYYRLDRMVHAGLTNDLQVIFNRFGGKLSTHDQTKVNYEILSELGWRDVLEAEVGRSIKGGLNPGTVGLICAHIIRRADVGVFARLIKEQGARPLAAKPENLESYMDLFCAAAVMGDRVATADFRKKIREITGANFVTLDAIEESLRDGPTTVQLGKFLPALPIVPLDVTYALYERFGTRDVIGAKKSVFFSVPSKH